jgi:predicted polyphosphate/ATP-dependent NAD kinase
MSDGRTGDAHGVTPPRVGLLVNPVAGIGGGVGLKGSDGPEIVRRALALGAVPHAGERAGAALARMLERWPSDRERPQILAGSGSMGELVARGAGLAPVVFGRLDPAQDPTAEDTRRIVAEMATAGLDLLLVAGGDGTARDICAAVGTSIPVLGIPAGVKMHSPVYATSPLAAGDLAAAFLGASPARRRTALAEVLDMDEDAYRRGEIAPRLFGELLVPAEDRRLQARKEPSPASEGAAAAGVAEGIARHLSPGRRCVLGPGSTVRAVAARLGVPKTLVGVDVVDVAACSTSTVVARLIAPDVGGAELERLVTDVPAVLVVTPIGGQGFILGRGNQQLSPAVVRSVLGTAGRDGILVAATPAKLASLRGRPFLVDSGDAALDVELSGYVAVVTGPDERTMYRVEPA